MPHLAVDRRSFALDGRRLWLISGSVHYTRHAPTTWKRRLQQARCDGLNCIDVPVPWSFHQPDPDTFSFTGACDLRAFLEQIADAGLRAIVRPGPYLGMGYDRGALPAWLAADPTRPTPVRDANPAFLAACSRYLTAVMEQIRPLQAATPQGGPVVLMQIENLWLAHHPELAATYLAQLVRYLREAGCQVPLCNNNRFFQPVEGTFTAWSGQYHLAADLRQVAELQPDAPLLVTDLLPDQEPRQLERGLADTLAAGAQTNLSAWDEFSSAQRQAVRRLTLFASQFQHVLADLEPTLQATLADPLPNGMVQLVHRRGRLGEILWLKRSGSPLPAIELPLLLPNGLTLPVPWESGEQVVWLLLKTRLGKTAVLDYTNLRPWALLEERALVLFGPAGSTGHLSIDGTSLEVPVPTSADAAPHIEALNGLTLIVLCDAHLATATLAPDAGIPALHLGPPDKPCRVTADGVLEPLPLPAPRPPRAPRLTAWQQAEAWPDLSPGASRAGDAPDAKRTAILTTPPGEIGWHAFVRSGPATTPRWPASTRWLSLGGGRIHLLLQGTQRVTLDTPPQPLPPRLLASEGGDASSLIALVENPPHPQAGADGLLWSNHHPGPIYPVKAMSLGQPIRDTTAPPDPRAIAGYVPTLTTPPAPSSECWHWSLSASGDHPRILEMTGVTPGAVVLLDDQPLQWIPPQQKTAHPVLRRWLLPATGRELTLIWSTPPDLRQRAELIDQIRFYQITGAPLGSDTDQAPAIWTPLPWSVPPADHFRPTNDADAPSTQPTWYRTYFSLRSPTDLRLDRRGFDRGVVFCNGSLIRHAASSNQETALLSADILREEGPNELLILSPDGQPPTTLRLSLSRMTR